MIKNLLIGLTIIIATLSIVIVGMRIYTKSFSQFDTVIYKDDHHQIEVAYCRPYKKQRTIFPNLVPYGEVWRTGANEATKITTSQNLKINNKILPKGTYSLWTKPNKDNWEIIFNKEYGQWGVNFMAQQANRDPLLDVLTVTVPVYQTNNNIEQFTIQFETWGEVIEMLLMWDHTIVVVPLNNG